MAGPLTVVIGPDRTGLAPDHRVPDLSAALALGGRLWIVDGAARPEPGALEALLAVADAAPLLVSLPVGSEAALPRGAEADTAGLIAAVGRGLVPIRHAEAYSLLVDASAVDAPEPGYGTLTARAWTARVLRRRPGYLVTASRVHVAPPPAADPRAVLRMARAGLFTRGETVRALIPRRRGSPGASPSAAARS